MELVEVQALFGNWTMLNKLNTFGDFRVELDSAWQRAVHSRYQVVYSLEFLT